MEFPGVGAAGAGAGGSNVPAFLTKLWTLVEDPDTDELICWSASGTSFHVFDQGRFSKEVLPKFFKHNNMASFIRQLNMYGFRKVVHIEQGGLLKPERDDTEFQHPFFLQGQSPLLENIKRKVTAVSSGRSEEVKLSADDVNKILSDVQLMKGKQETIDSRINAMKHENEALWREVATLRQKHVQQQKVVNKLIEFLVSLVHSNRIKGVKRKIPLMLGDSGSAHSLPKYSRQFSLEHMQAPAGMFADAPVTSGPIISDITEVATPAAHDVAGDCPEAGVSCPVKEELPSPAPEAGLTPVDTPLSPTTFINSILQEHETPPLTNQQPASSIVVMSPVPASPPTPPDPEPGQHQCQTVACIDRSELSEHVELMDNSLENLQTVLNNQTITFESSPLMEFFSTSCPSGDFDLDTLTTLLSDEAPKGSDFSSITSNAGKQLVQYMPQALDPSGLGDGGADLPSLLELEGEPFFSPAPDGDAASQLDAGL